MASEAACPNVPEDGGLDGLFQIAQPGRAARAAAAAVMRAARSQSRFLTARLPPALAIGLGLIEADAAYAGRIRAAQVGAIVRLTPLAMIASCLNATILLATLLVVGSLRAPLVVWAVVLFAGALYYSRPWARRRARDPDRPVSRRAIRRATLHGALFGVMWGAVPVMTFPDAPATIQLLIGCLSAGMMCAGGFVLATVPLAGWCYVALIMAGSVYALLAAGTTAIQLGLTALLTVYGAVVITNLTWNAQLFVEHFLAEARLRAEIAARERAQAEAAHAQRMTALGELSGGIAHDFNNILHAVAGSAMLITRFSQKLEQAGGPAEQQRAAQISQLADTIQDAAQRGGAISRRLLAFARPDMLNAEPIDPADILAGAGSLLRHTLDRGIKLRVAASEDLPRLLADRAQLETVLVNLASNARDAMPDGGSLTLRVALERLTQPRAQPVLAAGDYIRLSVTDTGAGMDAATLARASEPFFTTKPKGKGTGLGLPMAKGFAEQSGGALAVASTPGQGTTVTLWLPASRAPAVRPAADPRSPAAAPDPPASPFARHVLVVDDDALVRRTMIRSLAHAGFVLSGAADGAGALDRLDRGELVDILLTDFMMPGMNGIELINAAQRRRPGLPAILLTGHMGEVGAAVADGAEGANFVVLHKPVLPVQLAARLTAVLEGTAA